MSTLGACEVEGLGGAVRFLLQRAADGRVKWNSGSRRASFALAHAREPPLPLRAEEGTPAVCGSPVRLCPM